MTNYPVRMKKGIKGPAFIIVPISESLVDRAVFNGLVRKSLGKDQMESEDEMKKVIRIKWNNEDQILQLLEQSKIMVHYDPRVDELKAIEEYIFKHFKWKPEDERPIGIGEY